MTINTLCDVLGKMGQWSDAVKMLDKMREQVSVCVCVCVCVHARIHACMWRHGGGSGQILDNMRERV